MISPSFDSSNLPATGALGRSIDSSSPSKRGDRIGIVASVLCAIHCALTPVLLLVLPGFGRVWAHPAAHWAAALFVVPLAAWMLARGFARHRRKWVVAAGIGGIAFVLLGAAAPSLVPEPATAAAACADSCCPSLQVDEEGKRHLQIPAASILTTLGGLLLVTGHIGNLCRCRCCQPTPGSANGNR